MKRWWILPATVLAGAGVVYWSFTQVPRAQKIVAGEPVWYEIPVDSEEWQSVISWARETYSSWTVLSEDAVASEDYAYRYMIVRLEVPLEDGDEWAVLYAYDRLGGGGSGITPASSAEEAFDTFLAKLRSKGVLE